MLNSDQVVFDLRNVLVNLAAACPDRVQLGGNINRILPSGHDSATQRAVAVVDGGWRVERLQAAWADRTRAGFGRADYGLELA